MNEIASVACIVLYSRQPAFTLKASLDLLDNLGQSLPACVD